MRGTAYAAIACGVLGLAGATWAGIAYAQGGEDGLKRAIRLACEEQNSLARASVARTGRVPIFIPCSPEPAEDRALLASAGGQAVGGLAGLLAGLSLLGAAGRIEKLERAALPQVVGEVAADPPAPSLDPDAVLPQGRL